REQRLAAPGRSPGARNVQDLVDRHVCALSTARGARERAVVADVATELRQRDEDFRRIRDERPELLRANPPRLGAQLFERRREANELRAWIDVDDDGKITAHGHAGHGRIGVTRLRLGPKEISVRAVAMPTIQRVEVGDGWVRFTQTAGGRTGAPAPRSVRGKPYFQWSSAIAWTTLSLILYADGTSKHALVGASSFPRHWIYDSEGNLVEKSATIDFETWYREAHEQNTPWGDVDSPAVVTAAETTFERELSRDLMRDGAAPKPEELEPGTVLVEQGEAGNELFLLLDG